MVLANRSVIVAPAGSSVPGNRVTPVRVAFMDRLTGSTSAPDNSCTAPAATTVAVDTG
jgi:hypothetical protein